ncbi:hypothetical protein PP914_gp025 [Arthrobacter phage Qui]|uniref:Uncharacterized protein n=1 Tax=Arthrobacter phage Qui TaxID=2603260 RepID=A0A5B8WJY5_9CAUD|nr:hypothetical protein PP914_gp025 [Arthrobacter phage Qui]QED11516.1 hypothetical protein SEA_QUI_25 [Arthrobacter phage Qui]QOC56347.1 hypothetical protein SEA_PAELLA_25 [Arthrobacter phage Paella]
MSAEVDDFLAHYGVMGMKWGKHKAKDPYATLDKAAKAPGSNPDKHITKDIKAEENSAKLQAKATANAEKAMKYHDRAAKQKKLVEELDSLGIQSPEMRRLYGKAADQSDRMFRFTQGKSKEQAVAEMRQFHAKQQRIAEKDAIAKEQGKLSRGQKIAIGAGVGAAALLVAYGAYKYPDIVTRNAAAGENISVNNFMKRYTNRSTEYSNTKITKDMFHKLDDNDVVVPSGTKFRRMTAFKDEDLGGRLYTTHTSADNDKYQGLYGPMLKSRTGAKQLYINEMEMGESIKSPSHKKRVQALIDLINDDKPITGKEQSYFGEGPEKTKTARQWLEDMVPLEEYLKSDKDPVKGVPNEDLALKLYNTFARQIVGTNPLGGEYFNKIKGMGYNALIDDNDAKQLSDLPMILLDAAKTTKSRTSTPLTTAMEKEARKRLVEVLDGGPTKK